MRVYLEIGLAAHTHFGWIAELRLGELELAIEVNPQRYTKCPRNLERGKVHNGQHWSVLILGAIFYADVVVKV
jgi:hypothetical protein